MTEEQPSASARSATSPSPLRDLLSQVAAGSLEPDEAARRLPEGEPALRRLVIRMTAAKLVLIGDPSVTGVSVDGRHSARREDDTLIVTTEDERDPGDFAFDSTVRRFGRMIRGHENPEKIRVRVNPTLAVDMVVSAGSVVATGLHNGLTFTCDAGSIKASDCSGPIDGRVATGSVALDWLLDSGESRLRCELGSVKVRLHERSSVRIRARAELGSVDMGPLKQASGAGATREWTVGEGAGSLDVEVSLGTAKISVG